MSVYVIAEAGSCHMGSLFAAQDLLQTARDAGANAIKFQYWSDAARMRARRRVTDPLAYTVGSIGEDWLRSLSVNAHRREMDFLCTVYLPEDIATVAPYVDKFKVSSFEAGDEDFVWQHAGYKKDVIISTGMTTYDDFFTAKWKKFLNAISPSRVQWLHCVSAYPCPLTQANVGGVTRLVGYSDHTCDILTGAVAVGAGAQIVEVHFRLDDTPVTCSDYSVSLPPDELKTYIANVRVAEQLMGDGIKQPQECERANMRHRVVS